MEKMPTTRRQQWSVLLPLGLAMVLSLSGDLTLYAVLPAYAPTLGLALGAVGVLLSANRLIRLLSNPVAGLSMDRWGRRRLFLLGMGLGTLSTLTYVVPSQFWLFLLGRLLWGISWSLIFVGAYSVVSDITTPEDRGWGSGILRVFYFAGVAVNPLLGGILTDWLGFQRAFMVCALLSGLGLMIALAALPETKPASQVSTPSYWTARSGAALVQQLGGLQPSLIIRALARDRRILTADLLYLLAVFASDGIVMSTISLYLKQEYGDVISFGGFVLRVASVGGSLLAVRAVASAVVAPVAGYLSDRRSSRRVVVGCGAAIGVAGMCLLALGRDPWLLILSVVLVAVSGGTLGTVLPALVEDLAETQQRGTVMGGLMAAGDGGSAVAPLAVYSLLALVPLRQMYMISALAMAMGLVVSWLVLRGGKAIARVPRVGARSDER